MFDSVILDVLIGIVFVFLLLSALTSWINEVIAQLFRLRAHDLKQNLKKWIDSESGKSTVNELYNTGIIQSLYKDGKWRPGPSYISAHDFVSGLFEHILGTNPYQGKKKNWLN